MLQLRQRLKRELMESLPWVAPAYSAARRVAILSAGPGCVLAALQRNFAEEPMDPLPAGASVLVVGAGIVGVTTAHALASKGYRVR